jgi:hypothetical protein
MFKDEHPCPLPGSDQTVGSQAGNRLAYNSPADSEFIDQCLLSRQLVTRGKRSR